jgi:hypothetical protein
MKSIFSIFIISFTLVLPSISAETEVPNDFWYDEAQAYLRVSMLYMHKNEPNKAKDALDFAKRLYPSEVGLFAMTCKITSFQLTDMCLPVIKRRQFALCSPEWMLTELNSATVSMIVYHQLIGTIEKMMATPDSQKHVHSLVVNSYADTIPFLSGNYRLRIEKLVNHSLEQIDPARRAEEQEYMLKLYQTSGEERAEWHEELAELYLNWDKAFLAYAEYTLALEVPGISDEFRQKLSEGLTKTGLAGNHQMVKAKLL